MFRFSSRQPAGCTRLLADSQDRAISRASFLALLATPLLGAPPAGFAFDEFRARRLALRKQLGSGVAVLEGRTDAQAELSRDGFFQESNFFYLTGWREAGAALLLTADAETLYLPKRRPETDRMARNSRRPSVFQ